MDKVAEVDGTGDRVEIEWVQLGDRNKFIETTIEEYVIDI